MAEENFSLVRNLIDRITLLESQVEYLIGRSGGPLPHDLLERAIDKLENQKVCSILFFVKELEVDMWTSADLLCFLSDLGLIEQKAKDRRIWTINSTMLNDYLLRKNERLSRWYDSALYLIAKKMVLEMELVYLSDLRRMLRIGYPRAYTFMKMLETEGIVSAQDSINRSKARRVLHKKP
jgi:hypothetical protein